MIQEFKFSLIQFNKIFIQLENQGIEHHYLTVRTDGADPPPPSGQPDRKISVFLRLASEKQANFIFKMGGPCNILYSHVFVVHSLCCAEKVFVRLFSVSALLFINSYSFKSALFTFRTFSSFRRSFKLHTSCECCLDKAPHLRIRRGIVVGCY